MLRFVLFATVRIEITFFWDMTRYILVNGSPFRG